MISQRHVSDASATSDGEAAAGKQSLRVSLRVLLRVSLRVLLRVALRPTRHAAAPQS